MKIKHDLAKMNNSIDEVDEDQDEESSDDQARKAA